MESEKQEEDSVDALEIASARALLVSAINCASEHNERKWFTHDSLIAWIDNEIEEIKRQIETNENANFATPSKASPFQLHFLSIHLTDLTQSIAVPWLNTTLLCI